MATLIIPVRQAVPNQVLQVELEGVVFGMRLRWNTRASLWNVDLLAADDSPLLSGRRACLGAFLLPEPKRPEYPAGDLLVVDDGDGSEPTLENFGGTVQLVYVEAGG